MGGAARSALYAAAFAIQAANMRAAGNHVIQSTGAGITKKLQRNVWNKQPHGVGPWIVVPMNVHDEVNVPVKKGHEEAVAVTVNETVESFRPLVPLIEMKWKSGIPSWADK